MKKIQRMVIKGVAALSLLGCTTLSAFALDKETARAKGLAGEVDNGLMAIPPGASEEAKELIITINNGRRAEYAKIAATNNLPFDTVGTMMAEKIYERLPAGTWVQQKGVWVQKKP
uniref:DUF1318 domain-containing protein n=1 Tax=Chlorobium chlorochromatii (strain CaD3) TaxID=340177 RepID=Q3ARR9_CHLCH